LKRGVKISTSNEGSEGSHQELGRIVNREELLRASRFVVERRWQRLTKQEFPNEDLPKEELHSREVIIHPGAVVILPILDDGRICLIRNYRIAIDRELIELPAGTRELQEAPILTARRELQEETGYTAASLEPLCEFLMSPGILDERMHAFVATGLSAGTPALEQGEQIQNLLATWQEVQAWMAAGKIEDAKTITTLLFYLQTRSRHA
jgi:ADP-ribose pyrophosphatase